MKLPPGIMTMNEKEASKAFFKLIGGLMVVSEGIGIPIDRQIELAVKVAVSPSETTTAQLINN